ncbi:MAG: cation:proton antiporter [Phycisphaeraceae bacterium]|nr:cation:proton antiporter [Phycisphaeraceae bacterium]
MLDLLPTILIAAAEGHAAEPAGKAHSLMAGPLLLITQVGVGVLVLGILLCLYRMIKGPHLADRVLAGDTVAMLVAGLVVMLAIKYDSALFYDAALVVAILGFVSTVAFAQYIGAKNKSAPEMTPEPEEDTA